MWGELPERQGVTCLLCQPPPTSHANTPNTLHANTSNTSRMLDLRHDVKQLALAPPRNMLGLHMLDLHLLDLHLLLLIMHLLYSFVLWFRWQMGWAS